MRFHDGSAGIVHGRSGSNIRHRGVYDVTDSRHGRVDAMRRQQLVLGAQIGRWKTERPTALIASCDGAVDEVLMPQQGAGLVDAAFADEAADACTAHDE